MAPVDVVELYLHEVPTVLAVPLHEPFPRALVAVVGEAEVPYPPGVPFAQAELYRPVVHVAALERLEAPHADRVQEIVVYHLGAEEFAGLLVHLPALLDRVLRRREVGELGGDPVRLARMAGERPAGNVLRLSPAVCGGRVEVVDAMLQRIIHLGEHLVGVYRRGRSALIGIGSVNGGQPHHAVSEQGYAVAVRILAHGHPPGRLRLYDPAKETAPTYRSFS